MRDESRMNDKESACCRIPHGKCGQMSKRDCCRMELRAGERPQLLATAPRTNVHWAVIAWLGLFAAGDRAHSPSLLQIATDHAPPGFASSQFAVLRI
jgi:hypothetical protein